MSKYIPLPPPQDVESIPLYLQNELQKISNATEKEEVSGCLGEANLTRNLGRTTASSSGRDYFKMTMGGYGSSTYPQWAQNGYTTDSSLVSYDTSNSTITINKPCKYVVTLTYSATEYVNALDISPNFEISVDGKAEAVISNDYPDVVEGQIVNSGTVTSTKSFRVALQRPSDPYASVTVGMNWINLNVRCYSV
jgi:ABC-type Fe3+-hydroxamate transport system substrate-binding protein